MNSILKEIRQKSRENDKQYPYVSSDDILLIRSKHSEHISLIDIYKWMKDRGIKNKIFNNLDLYIKNQVKIPNTLDKLTPICLFIMENMITKTQQPIVYYLTSGVLTKKGVSHFLTSSILSKKLRVKSKEISVHLAKLVDKGIVTKRINNKKYEYKINSDIFIKWFNFRYNNKPILLKDL